MTTKKGGWAYFLNRFDGSLDFYKNWDSYKNGFGSLTSEFWLGLEYLHWITESGANEFLVEVTNWFEKTTYARYDDFLVGDEKSGYPVEVLGQYTGDAGDRIYRILGMKFTTHDRDQDLKPELNCALMHHGGWWYRQCTATNPTSTYFKHAKTDRLDVMFWNRSNHFTYPPKKLKMMIRPKRSSIEDIR